MNWQKLITEYYDEYRERLRFGDQCLLNALFHFQPGKHAAGSVIGTKRVTLSSLSPPSVSVLWFDIKLSLFLHSSSAQPDENLIYLTSSAWYVLLPNLIKTASS